MKINFIDVSGIILLYLIYYFVNVIFMEILKEIKVLKFENEFDSCMGLKKKKKKIMILLMYLIYFFKVMLMFSSLCVNNLVEYMYKEIFVCIIIYY